MKDRFEDDKRGSRQGKGKFLEKSKPEIMRD